MLGSLFFPMFPLEYYLILGVGLVLSLWAQSRVKGAFAKWSQVRSRSGLSGAQVARAILHAHDILDITVEAVPGKLTDHYDPRSKTLRLSEPVYNSPSVAALGIAAHEVGHAIQHARSYKPLQFRSAWVPMASLGTGLGEILIVIGLVLSVGGQASLLAWIGLCLFGATTVFTLITLPVEFDASKRAVATLEKSGVLAADELIGARAVLNAAALTYVAAAAASLMQLLYWLFLILGRQRDD